MKKTLIAIAAVVALSANAFALNLDLSANSQNGSGYGSVGVSDSMWAASVGFANTKTETTATDTEAATEVTQTSIPIQVNGIYALDSNVELTYGVKYVLESGDLSATEELDTANTLGIFVGVKTSLTDSLSLTANYFPYSTSTEQGKNTGSTEKTVTNIGGSVQVRATYSLGL